MTMQTYVFMKKTDVPTLDELQTAITDNGFDYQLPEGMDLFEKSSTFIEGKFEGLESCFDYLFDPYDANDWEWTVDDKKLLNSPDCLAVFNTFSNAQEIVGMLVTSSVLTKISNGVMLSDFFDDELVPAGECIDFAKDIVEGSREQFSGPSKLRG